MFDPYLQWLKIPVKERPITYYRLLDIDPTEKDPDVIAEAAEDQAARVQRHENGPHRQDCIRIIKEIEQARDTLLDPGKRKLYAAKIRQLIEDEDDSPRGKGRKKKNQNIGGIPTWIWTVGGLVALVLVALGIVWGLLELKERQKIKQMNKVMAPALVDDQFVTG